MDVILGIDIGSSTTKIVGLRTNGSVVSMLRVRAADRTPSPPARQRRFLSSSSRRAQSAWPGPSGR